MKSLLKKMSTTEKLSFLFLILVLIISIIGPYISPYPPQETHLLEKDLPPAFAGGSTDYLLGTDELGRDLLSRILQATRISMAMAMMGMVCGSLLGISLGLTAGFFWQVVGQSSTHYD